MILSYSIFAFAYLFSKLETIVESDRPITEPLTVMDIEDISWLFSMLDSKSCTHLVFSTATNHVSFTL